MSSAVTRITAAAASFRRVLARFVWFRFHLWKGEGNRQEKAISSRDTVLTGLLQARGSMNGIVLHAVKKSSLVIGRNLKEFLAVAIMGHFAGLRDLNSANCVYCFNKTDKTMSSQCVLLSFCQRVFGNTSKQDKI